MLMVFYIIMNIIDDIPDSDDIEIEDDVDEESN